MGPGQRQVLKPTKKRAMTTSPLPTSLLHIINIVWLTYNTIQPVRSTIPPFFFLLMLFYFIFPIISKISPFLLNCVIGLGFSSSPENSGPSLQLDPAPFFFLLSLIYSCYTMICSKVFSTPYIKK